MGQIFVVDERVTVVGSAAEAVTGGKYFCELGSMVVHIFYSLLSHKIVIVLRCM